MNESKVEKILKNAKASIEIEGLSIDEQTQNLCKQLLLKEITMEEYINLIKMEAGISSKNDIAMAM